MSSPTDRNEQWHELLQRQAGHSEKSWTVALVLSVLLGLFGADRFYLEQYTLGMFKLFTLGGGMFWWAADIILLLTRQMKDADGKFVTR
jgi:TM2 domain-containing membrane protein YozV